MSEAATNPPEGRLLNATRALLRVCGSADLTGDALRRAAGGTKVTFFQHVASSEDLALASAQHWHDATGHLRRPVGLLRHIPRKETEQ